MSSQAGQPVAGGNKKNGFNWTRFIITILFIGGIGVLAAYLMGAFTHKPSTKTFNEFQNDVRKATADPADEIYFEKVTRNPFTNKVEVIYHDGKSSHEYEFYGADEFKEVYIRNGNSKNSSINKAFVDPDGTPTALAQKDPAKHGSYTSGSAPKQGFNWVGLIVSLLPIFLLIGVMIWLAKKQGAMGGGIMSNKSVAKKVISDKRFTDIAGNEEVKEEVREVVDFLKNPSKYKAAGAKVPKGILLGGPPGTGKTLVAKATAGEAEVPFYFISASNFVEMFAGLGAKRVRSMFADARRNAPAILFIDELDAIARKRGSSLSGNDEREQTLNQILVEMDGMTENQGLLVLAATNRPDVLDPAILRPGRFDRTITLKNPDIKEREEILILHAKGKRIDSAIDFANIAKRVAGYSGAELESIINEAALLSVRENTGVITIEQIDEAIDRVKAGPAKKNRVIDQSELEMIAYHEAGHAVIGLEVPGAHEVQKITIIPRGDAGGYNLMTPKKETYNYKKSDLMAMIMSSMGGRAAEQIIYGKGEVSTGAHNDIQQATNIARAMVTQYGMSELGPIAYEQPQGSQFLGYDSNRKDYSESISEKIDNAVRKLIVEAEEEAIVIIKKHNKLLKLIAEELLEKETIVKEEIEYIFKYLKRPPKKTKIQVKKKDKDLLSIIKEVKTKKTRKTTSEKTTKKTESKKTETKQTPDTKKN